jgi:amino acid adenylation domain-containing protein
MLNGSYSEKLTIAANQNIKERDYWLNQLSGSLERTAFFYDSRTVQTPHKEKVEWAFAFSGTLFQQLMKLSSGSDARLHMILAAGLAVLLHKYTDSNDIILGTPIYKQAEGSEFINTVLVLRNPLEKEKTFKELLLQVRQTVVEAVENQNYPIEILVERLNLSMIPGQFPLFDIALLLENVQDRAYLRPVIENINMIFTFIRTGECIKGKIVYNPSLYWESTVTRIYRHYEHILEQVLFDVNLPLFQIETMPPEEKSLVLEEFNRTDTDEPEEGLLHRLFEDQAARTPGNTALLGPSLFRGEMKFHQLTYGELNRGAGHLAFQLRERSVDTGSIVGIQVNPSVEMIVGLLAILKAGGAYLPIDPGCPEARVRYMLEDSCAKLLLTEVDEFSGNPDIFHPAGCGSSDPAYVIYTSGTTGRPKGVMAEHRNVTAYLHAFYREFDIRSTHTAIQLAAYTFDVFVEEVYPILLRGGKVIIPGASQRTDMELLGRLISRHGVNFIDCTPLLLNEFNKLHFSPSWENIFISGGDVLKGEYVDNLVDVGAVYNTYGPTETTVCATYYRLPDKGTPPRISSTVPIGKPISNYKVFILDENGYPVPVGVPGELCVSGSGVARGYLNRPELTAEKFIRSYGACTLYKTGDLARWLPDGEIEFLGRIDHQVKIRGFRIELGEIENTLLAHNDISEAVVVRKTDDRGEEFLCGYFVSDNPVDASQLRDFLGKKLPTYMVPWFFVRLEKMPLTPHGKIDRRALPEPGTGEKRAYAAPRDESEKKLAVIWAQVLTVPEEEIGIDTNFFDLGGNSLAAIVTVSKIHKAFDVKMQLTDIFELQTIREIAHYIRSSVREHFIAIEPAPKKEYYALASAQKRLYILQQLDRTGTVYNMPGMVKLDGEVEKGRLEQAFLALTRRHDCLRTSFQIVGGLPVQRIHDSVDFEIEYCTLRCPHGDEDRSRYGETDPVARFIANFIRPFDLSRAPLVRIGLVETEEGDHIFLADIHHIISDAVSQNILIRDLISLYRGEALPELRLQYKDYTEWRNRGGKEDKTLRTQEEYWLKVFDGEIPVLALPTDYPRPDVKSFEGASISFEAGEEVTRRMRTAAADTGATLYLVLLSAFYVLLARYCDQEDIVVGSVVAGRGHSDLENIIGMFVNTLALRGFPQKEKSFDAFLREVKERALRAYENQDYPFEDLVDKLPVNRDTGRDPLFDVMFVMDNAAPSSSTAPAPQYEFGGRTSKFDLVVYAAESPHTLRFTFEYRTALFKPETIDQMFRDYVRVLETVGGDRGIKIMDIPLETPLMILENSFQDVDLDI